MEVQPVSPRDAQERDARRAWLIAGTAFAAAVVANIRSDTTDGVLLYAALGLAATGSIVVALFRNRGVPRGPWLLIASALMLFMVTGFLRSEAATLGDLSSRRTIVPDVVGLPAYLLLGLGLIVLIRARRRLLSGTMDLFIDALTVGLSVLAVAWVYLVSPTLGTAGTPLATKLVLAAYPLASVIICVCSAQMFFTGRRRTGETALAATFAAMGSLFVGDIVSNLADFNVLAPPAWLINLPYGLAFSSILLLAWHPSFRAITRPVAVADGSSSKVRLFTLGFALVIPAAVAVSWTGASLQDRIVLGAICLAVALFSVVRVLRALALEARISEHLTHQATHDGLTDLFNREAAIAHLAQRLEDRIVDQTAVAVLFLDLDRFKLVNDTFGHSMGDDLLLAISVRLRALPTPVSLVARIGGDEFVLVLHRVGSVLDAVSQADRVRTELAVPVQIGDVELPVSVSIGVAYADATQQDLDPATLLRDADTAMYRAKDTGRDAVVVFDSAMRDRTARRLELETDLRRAVERRELAVHYQPIIDMPTERITGFEALVRWNHPVHGTISPGEFIPIAEETGIIVDLGAWVLDTAVAELACLRAELTAGHRFTMAVNVSTRQLTDDSLIAAVSDVLARHAVPPDRLFLEVTESVLMDDPDTKALLLGRLRDLGLKLSIDDFGTGYSSLAYLQRFPFDRVKIDRAFVEGLDRREASGRSLIPAILAMTAAMGLDAIAEGVETPQEAEALVALGCGLAQGFLWSRPVPADQIAAAIVRLGIDVDQATPSAPSPSSGGLVSNS